MRGVSLSIVQVEVSYHNISTDAAPALHCQDHLGRTVQGLSLLSRAMSRDDAHAAVASGVRDTTLPHCSIPVRL
jgi:hypothetical protein